MTQVIQVSELNLHDVEEKFHFQQVEDEQFFREWQDELAELADAQKQWLDRVKANFPTIKEYSLHEEIVKLAVLAPLQSPTQPYLGKECSEVNALMLHVSEQTSITHHTLPPMERKIQN